MRETKVRGTHPPRAIRCQRTANGPRRRDFLVWKNLRGRFDEKACEGALRMNRPELVRSVYTVTERPLHVVGDGEQKPVAKSIWYVLATIAGEPGKTPNPVDTIARNRFFWNSFMTARLDPLNPAITDLKPGLHLPGWLPETRQTIREVLNARGFVGSASPMPMTQSISPT